MNIWIGGEQRDDGRGSVPPNDSWITFMILAFAKHLTEFLLAYANQIVFLYSRFNVNEFSTNSFDGVLYKRCLVESVRDYLEKLRHTLVSIYNDQ